MIIPLEEGVTAEVERGLNKKEKMEKTTFQLPPYQFSTPQGNLPAGYEVEIVKTAQRAVTAILSDFLQRMADAAEKQFLRQSVGIEEGAARKISDPNDKKENL